MSTAALVIGSTGLVGSQLLDQLCAGAAFYPVISLGRRAPALQSPKLTHVPYEFDGAAPSALAPLPPATTGAAVFCALGTTLRNCGGDRDLFRRIDQAYVLAFAAAALAQGARHFVYVSSQGANPRSPFFYLMVKGETEEKLKALGYPKLTILRPSLLTGPRAERRRGERFAQILTSAAAPLLKGPLAALKPTPAAAVARAAIRHARVQNEAVEILEAAAIRG